MFTEIVEETGKVQTITGSKTVIECHEDLENTKFGEHIADVCDEVILVGKEQTKAIYKGLKNKKYSEDKIHILEDVIDAFSLINKLKGKETYVLLENDLPDACK